jgi:hypothetical protein
MPFAGWVLVAAAISLHLYVVYSIAAQPLDASSHPETARAVIWPLHYDTIHRIGPGADFFAIYHAGQSLDAGLNPYAPEEEPYVTPYFFPFRYPPVVAATLGVVMVRFPPQEAYRLWLLILEIVLGLLLLVLARRVKDRRLRCFVICTLLLSSPYFLELYMGQFTFVTSSLLCLALLAQEEPHGRLARQWARLAGIASYVSAALLKVFPLVTIPSLLRHRRYWPSLLLASSALLVASVPYFVSHPNAWQLFYEDKPVQSWRDGSGQLRAGLSDPARSP